MTPNAEVFVTQPGIFRINAGEAQRTEVIARKGEALVNGQRVKSKRKALASSGEVTVSEIDTKLEDGFDSWSHERASNLVEANKLLKKEPPWANKTKQEETSDRSTC